LIPDADIWRAALLMTQCFRRDAAFLQAVTPGEGEGVH
jgi:hypothetical protein